MREDISTLVEEAKSVSDENLRKWYAEQMITLLVPHKEDRTWYLERLRKGEYVNLWADCAKPHCRGRVELPHMCFFEGAFYHPICYAEKLRGTNHIDAIRREFYERVKRVLNAA